VASCGYTDRKIASRAVALALLLVPPGALLGCSNPTAPPAPPSGGQTLILDYGEFVQNVEPVLMQNGCDTPGGGDCHGAGIRGTLELSPAGAKDTQFDFDQVSLQVSPTTRDSSRILTRPLAISAGGTPHSGTKPFGSVNDPGYQAIHLWIMHGVLR
jgi:hypothetical protein